MKIAAQTIGYFMPYLQKGESVDFNFAKETLNNIKKFGYDGVQLSGFGKLTNELIDFYKKTCEDLELEIVATHINFQDLTENLELVKKAQKEWKCKLCGLGSMPLQFQKNIDTYLEFTQLVNKIAQELAIENIKFIYHMHAFEFIKYDNKFGLEILMDNTDKKNVGFLIDTYWAQYGGVNPVDLIRKYSDRLDTIHLKDMKIIPTGDTRFELGKQVICHIGEGNLNFLPIISEAKKLNFQWLIIEQDYSLDKDINYCYGESLKTLKNLI